MSTAQEVVVAIFMCSSLIAGLFIGSNLVASDIKENAFDGYHCQEIQKVKTLEEAKAIVKQYQERVRGE